MRYDPPHRGPRGAATLFGLPSCAAQVCDSILPALLDVADAAEIALEAAYMGLSDPSAYWGVSSDKVDRKLDALGNALAALAKVTT